MTERKSRRIAELNDGLRRTFEGGLVVRTPGVEALGPELVARVQGEVRAFAAFTEDNDPYGEHDFGSLEVDGRRLFWKIDCHDRQARYGSPDPADPGVTLRVLTVMLAEEY